MAKKHLIKSKVLHNGREFKPGEKCPDELVAHFVKIGVAAELPGQDAPEPAPAVKPKDKE